MSLIASLGSMFSTSVFAQASNGAEIISQINSAQKMIDYITENGVCSSTYFPNSTFLSECNGGVNGLAFVINEWRTAFEAGTLTVRFDAAIESSLFEIEQSMQQAFNLQGYSFNVNAIASRQQLQISPDSLEPDSSPTVCALCGGSAAAGYFVCLTTIEAPPVAAVCGVGVALGYLACAWDACIAPPEPPKMCPA